MPVVFINYRNSDEPYAAALIDTHLCSRFGAANVFRASRSIPIGVDFAHEVRDRLRECQVLVAVIGSRWTAERSADGAPRLYEPDDWVRQEIAIALKLGLLVVPVLVDRADLLRVEDVPAELAALASRQYIRMHRRNVEADLRLLAARLETSVPRLGLVAVVAEPVAANREDGAMLLAEHAVVPFHGRDSEMVALTDWCDDDALPVRLITGPSGQGKTRLANELIVRMRARKWSAGRLATAAASAAVERIVAVDVPTLLVIDRADAHPALVGTVLGALGARPPGTVAMRLLLIARSAGEWIDLAAAASSEDGSEMLGRLTPDALPPLSVGLPAVRAELALAVTAFARHLDLAVPATPAAIGGTGTVLEVHARALAHVLDDTAAADPFRLILHRERDYWRRSAAAVDLPDPHQRRIDQLVAAATLFATDDDGEAYRTLAALRTLSGVPVDVVDRYLHWIRSLFGGPGALNPMLPDRLAEDHVAHTLDADPRLLDVVAEISDQQAMRAVTVLARAAMRHSAVAGHLAAMLGGDPGRLIAVATGCFGALDIPDALLAAMSAAAAQADFTTLDAIVAALPQRSAVLAGFAADVTGRALQGHRALAPGSVATARLARLYAMRLTALRTAPDAALRTAREAVAIWDALPDGDAVPEGEATVPAQRAESWATLALAAADAGLSDEAIRAGDEAIRRYRGIASGADRIDAAFATALHNQSIRRGRAGKCKIAYRLATDALDRLGDLARTRPRAYLSLLADLLDNLSVQAARCDLLPEAVEAATSALLHRRTLAERRPDAYAATLAATLCNTGRILARAMRVDEARGALIEAVDLLDTMSVRFPGRFDADARTARHNLAALDADSRGGSATVAITASSAATGWCRDEQ